jgi:hypothetical protein
MKGLAATKLLLAGYRSHKDSRGVQTNSLKQSMLPRHTPARVMKSEHLSAANHMRTLELSLTPTTCTRAGHSHSQRLHCWQPLAVGVSHNQLMYTLVHTACHTPLAPCDSQEGKSTHKRQGLQLRDHKEDTRQKTEQCNVNPTRCMQECWQTPTHRTRRQQQPPATKA